MQYQALSILKPAVTNILLGKKNVEIRSWQPPSIPLYNIVLVQNEKYLTNQYDKDFGIALAIVDFTDIYPWTEGLFLAQGSETTMNKKWTPGYYVWAIENVRQLENPIPCTAMKGIYNIEIDII